MLFPSTPRIAFHSLTVRLLSSVLLFSVCVTLILTVVQLYLEYRHDVSDLELRLDQIGKTNLDSLAERLWALDENQLRLQLTGILRLPDMRAVEVREASNTGNPLVIRLGERSASSTITREYPLLYNAQGQNTRIGTLYVQATLVDLRRRLVHTGWTIFLNQAAEIFLVSLFIVYIFHKQITRHLFAIATFAASYRISDPSPPLQLRRPTRRHEDELQRVVTAFNILSDNLQAAYRSLNDINEQLSRDVAARRQTEAVLREREARIRRLIDADIIGIFLWDIEGLIFEANDAFLLMVGYDRGDLVSGRLRWTDLTPPEWRERDAQQWVAELKMTGRMQPMEKEYLRKDGSRVPVLIGSASFEESANQGVAFVLDLTERKRAEEALREAQANLARVARVTTMGELTASLAHELNQPIAAAVVNAYTCLQWLGRKQPDLEEARAAATRIVGNGKLAGELITRIRSQFEKTAVKREAVDVNEVIREMIALLRSEVMRHNISIRVELADDLPQIIGDRVQLQQVAMNLIMNSIDAMKGVDGLRELIIKSRRPENEHLIVSVSDTGIGLPSQQTEQIFNAFFTTKPHGTGMGLRISRSIVEAHGGRLWASANDGRGATFYFTLPTQTTHTTSVTAA
ncbi:sensor histidine kinase [Acidicapsa acidisoli]|uniref:sensor histidine kinase n=1 Tax=Acidicapsa acidisoli TaxID=1615681 RepID=UPI0021E0B743|nr:ATP-binding protein [Acidicapsa acidisoli]